MRCLVGAGCWGRVAVSVSLAVAVSQQARAAEGTRQPDGKMLHVGDAHLPYVTEGTGIPCIVVSGGLVPGRLYSRELRQHIRFTFLYSREDVPPDKAGDVERATLDTFVDDIEHLRIALGSEKVCVVGNSIFGLLALAYAQKHPESTSHVIMVGTPPDPSADTPEAQRGFVESHASPERKAALRRKQARAPERTAFPNCFWCPYFLANAPLYFYDADYDPSWLLEGIYVNDKVNPFEFPSVYDLGKKGVSTPVFLALGKYDFAVRHVLWNGREDALPCLTIELFEQSGHFPMLEEQELFGKRLLDWLSRQGSCR